MPCYLDTNQGMKIVSKELAHQIAVHRIALQHLWVNERNFPHYKNDPSYNWGRKK